MRVWCAAWRWWSGHRGRSRQACPGARGHRHAPPGGATRKAGLAGVACGLVCRAHVAARIVPSPRTGSVTMRIARRPLATALVLAISTSFAAAALAPAEAAGRAPAAASEVLIPYEEFTLPNGLRVVVHTARKAPSVAVNIWYHVGSKDEPAGRSGFAHLFEHLMFNGSENHRDEYFAPFEMVGATDMNGTTWLDRTNYFQNVPTTA